MHVTRPACPDTTTPPWLPAPVLAAPPPGARSAAPACPDSATPPLAALSAKRTFRSRDPNATHRPSSAPTTRAKSRLSTNSVSVGFSTRHAENGVSQIHLIRSTLEKSTEFESPSASTSLFKQRKFTTLPPEVAIDLQFQEFNNTLEVN